MLLFPAPAGRPLLKKGVNPFRSIVQKHIARHHFAGDVVGCCERMIDLAVEGLLAETDRRRTPGQNDLGESPNFGVQTAARDDSVDQPPGLCGRSIDGLASQKHFHGVFPTDVPDHTHRRRRAEHTNIYSWHSERRGVSRDGKIAHRDKLAPGRCRYALDSCDYWLRNLSERHHHPAAGVEQAPLPALVFRVGTHLLQVVPCAKALSLGSEDHSPHGSVTAYGTQLFLYRSDHPARQRIESLRTIESEGSDSVLHCREGKWLLSYQSSVGEHNPSLPSAYQMLKVSVQMKVSVQ